MHSKYEHNKQQCTTLRWVHKTAQKRKKYVKRTGGLYTSVNTFIITLYLYILLHKRRPDLRNSYSPEMFRRKSIFVKVRAE